jgi:hypothetical protein
MKGSNERQRRLIDTFKAPIIQIGKNPGHEITENYDLGAGLKSRPETECWRL